jgi:hypothetical protein
MGCRASVPAIARRRGGLVPANADLVNRQRRHEYGMQGNDGGGPDRAAGWMDRVAQMRLGATGAQRQGELGAKGGSAPRGRLGTKGRLSGRAGSAPRRAQRQGRLGSKCRLSTGLAPKGLSGRAIPASGRTQRQGGLSVRAGRRHWRAGKRKIREAHVLVNRGDGQARRTNRESDSK